MSDNTRPAGLPAEQNSVDNAEGLNGRHDSALIMPGQILIWPFILVILIPVFSAAALPCLPGFCRTLPGRVSSLPLAGYLATAYLLLVVAPVMAARRRSGREGALSTGLFAGLCFGAVALPAFLLARMIDPAVGASV